MSLGPAPRWKHLSEEKARAMLTALRAGVAPILANNLLPHFTDHSIEHSDSVSELIDNLLENAPSPLTNHEILILYSACYLHDIGMQFGRAGETDVISALNLLPPWSGQSDAGKRELLRAWHNRLSAELVNKSVGVAAPPIGFHLTPDFGPEYIASLCCAHCVDTDSAEYATLVEEGPGIRLPLLSALLRLADILDESRRRATRERARTLELDLDAQTHWWRHYYTEGVTFDPRDRIITIWFDFPPDRLPEYKMVVPVLQIPLIEAEIARHAGVLLKNGLGWSVRYKSQSKPYSNAEEMPETVLTAMLKQLASRRAAADEQQRLLALTRFQEARPSIERRLQSLKDREPSMDPGDSLLELSNIAFDLFDLGGRISARWALYHRYLESLQHLSLDDRLRIGTRLLEVLVDDGQDFEAAQLLQKLTPLFQTLPISDERKGAYAKLEIRTLIAACAYEEAKAAITAALQWAAPAEKASLTADLAEIELLQGDFEQKEEG